MQSVKQLLLTIVRTKKKFFKITSHGLLKAGSLITFQSNNWILQTALHYFDDYQTSTSNGMGDTGTDGSKSKKRLPHFVTSNIEHDAIKLVLENFQRNNLADVTFVPVRHTTGAVDTGDVMAAITPNTVMVSVMLANNETGVIQPVSEICGAVQALNRGADETRRILLHTDAAQAFGKIPVDVSELGVDYLTIVGHKFYGPRIGAVFAKNPNQGTPLIPVLFGGGQERGLRPGTENTPMIAGLGKAAELVSKNMDKYRSHMEEVRNYLEKQLEAIFGQAVCFNGKLPSSQRLPNTCNVSFIGQDLKGHEILAQVPSIQASVGAACHSQQKPSHILISSGVPQDVAEKALRLSVGRETSKYDIDVVVKDLCNTLIKSFILIKS